MGSVNVSGRRKAVKRKRNRILPGHSRRAYERTRQHLQEQTEDAGETAYESTDEFWKRMEHVIEEGVRIGSQMPRDKGSVPDFSFGFPYGDTVNMASFKSKANKHTITRARANDYIRRTAAKQYTAQNAAGKKQRFKHTRQTLRKTAHRASNSIHSILTAAKNLIVSLSAGGWIVVILVLIVCIVGLVVSSPFGVFFSGEDTGTGQTMQDAVRVIDQEYSDRLSQLRLSTPHDSVEMSGSRAVWPDVLTVYAVRATMDPDAPMEAASMTDEKLQLLTDIFWQMNEISHYTQTVTRTEIIESADEEGNILEKEVQVTRTILYITVAHKTAAEMAQELGFDEAQLLQMDELLSDDYRSLWSAVLYGIHSSDEQIVSVALSQVGNVGGAPYWSWYGFESRVEWCACFVSWCGNECGYIDTGIIPKFASCRNGMLWFQSRGQWLPGTAEPTPGMIVFFDWDDEDGQDGLPDHVGIVHTVKNGIIYTIEGNSGNACKLQEYPVGYCELLGFGCPAY